MRFKSGRDAGLYLAKEKHYTDAVPHLTSALAEDPTDTDVLLKLAVCATGNGDLQTAEELCKRVLQLDHTDHKAWHLMGGIASFAGDYEQAERLMDRCLEIAPNMPACMWNRSHIRLARGDYENGFKDFRYGRQAKLRSVRAEGKEWDGEYVKTLFVWCEEGHGDTFQMLRYIPLLCKLVGHVVLEVYKPQLALVDFQDFPCTVVAQPEDWHNPYSFDAHVGLMDLPRVLGVKSPDDVDGGAYLKPPPGAQAEAKIGVCWKGTPTHSNDAQRSIPEDALSPWERFRMVSLQKDETLFGWESLHLGDYAQTASVLSGLDLLVTVDTSVAHLAGALGVRTWMIAPLNHEWRWGTKGEKTCWYDSVKVFRPNLATGFAPVIEEIARELDRTSSLGVSGHGERLPAQRHENIGGDKPTDVQRDSCVDGPHLPDRVDTVQEHGHPTSWKDSRRQLLH